jgi:hypothetical protein
MVNWVKENNIQIPTIMVVTDGCSNGVNTLEANNLYHFCSQDSTATVTNDILDTIIVLPKKYTKSGLPNAVIASMLDSLRIKLNARCIGMYVMSGRSLGIRAYEQFCMSQEENEKLRDAGSYQESPLETSDRFKAASEAFKEGCLILHEDTFPGYDSYFLIQTTKPVKDEEAVATTGNFTKVKNAFIKTMGKRAGSRVFLSRYVDIVAGVYGLPAFPEGFKFRQR